MAITQIRGFDQTKPGTENIGIKKEVRFATTAPIVLATTGLAVIDGVTPVAGDRALVKNQATIAENGIYIASAGAWTRALDAAEDGQIFGGEVTYVLEGTSNGLSGWINSTTVAPIVVGTTDQTFALFTVMNAITNANNIVREVPGGLINGANVTFTLANTPFAGKESLYLNGLLQNVGGGNDYTITGLTITMNAAPKAAPGNPDVLLASYTF
jgi:phage-related tail fiber protein